MKDKHEVISAATLVRDQFALILCKTGLLESKEERNKAGIVVFTNKCPFQLYSGLFLNNASFPKGPDKYKAMPLHWRYAFWDEFIHQINNMEEQEVYFMIESASLQADLKVSNSVIFEQY